VRSARDDARSTAHDHRRYIYRLLFIIPMAVPGLVGTLLWRFILEAIGGR